MKEGLIKIGDKTYKEAKVIMLPTGEKIVSGIVKHIHDDLNTLHFKNDETHYEHEDYHPQHLYIVTSEEIKEGDLYYNKRLNQIFQALGYAKYNTVDKEYKIIASTDPSLITKEYDGLDEKGQKQYCNKTLPKPSSDFIKKYCELNGDIKDVLVELLSDTKSRIRGTVHYGQPVNSIKIAPDNTISIIKKQNNFKELYMKALKKLDVLSDEQLDNFVNFQSKYEEKKYTEQEVRTLMFRSYNLCSVDEIPRSTFEMDKWIDKQLK